MMPSLAKSLPLIALLVLSTAAASQEAPAEPTVEGETLAEPAPAEGAEPAPAEGAADPAAELNMGEPVDGAGPRPGEPYLREEFGDWSLRCLRVEEGPEPCELYQLLLDQEGNAVAEISMFPLPPGGEAVAGATIVTPLETLLTEELTLSVDGTATRRYPFTFCNRAGCIARVGFTAEEVEQFKRGSAAELSIVPFAAPDQVVTLAISLSGFTAGFDSSAVPSPAE